MDGCIACRASAKIYTPRLKQLQKAAGLVQDGYAGPVTIKAVTSLISNKIAATAQVTALETKIKNAKEALR